jgi:hypothetical protein
LAEDPEGKFGIRGREVKAADEAPNFLINGSGSAPLLRNAGVCLQIAAGAKGVEQEPRKTLEIGGRGGETFLLFRDSLGIAGELVEADGHGLAQIHGAVLFTSRNAQEPMAVAEVRIRKAALLRTEKKGNATVGKVFADEGSGLLKTADRVLQLTLPNSCGSNNEVAILDGFSESLELLGTHEQRRGADGGTRFSKGQLVGVHHTKMEEAEIAHGAGGRADVEGIPRFDENDAQVIEFGARRQERRVYCRRETMK